MIVDRPGESGTQASKVGSSIHGVDRVGEGVDRLGVGVAVLDCHLHADAVHLPLHVDRRVEHLPIAIQVPNKGEDATLEVEGHPTGIVIGSLVHQTDGDTAGDERHLPHPLRQGGEAILHVLEDGRIETEEDGGPLPLRLADGLHRALGHTLLVALPVPLVVAGVVYHDLHPFGERVDRRYTHAVQPSRDLVAAAAELRAGVEGGHHQLHRGYLPLWMRCSGDTTPVVPHGHALVLVDGHVDLVTSADQGLIDGVVDHLVDQVVKGAPIRATDVHAGSPTDCLQPLQHLDIGCFVARHTVSGFLCHATLRLSCSHILPRVAAGEKRDATGSTRSPFARTNFAL